MLDKFRERERNGRKKVLERIVTAYLKQAPADIDRLREAVNNGDLMAVRSAAHAMKSSSANVGAMRLSTMCQQLESRARKQVSADLDAQLADIDEMFSKVIKALSAQCPRQAA